MGGGFDYSVQQAHSLQRLWGKGQNFIAVSLYYKRYHGNTRRGRVMWILRATHNSLTKWMGIKPIGLHVRVQQKVATINFYFFIPSQCI